MWKIGGLEFLRVLKAYLLSVKAPTNTKLLEILYQNKVPGEDFDKEYENEA